MHSFATSLRRAHDVCLSVPVQPRHLCSERHTGKQSGHVESSQCRGSKHGVPDRKWIIDSTWLHQGVVEQTTVRLQ